MLRSIVGFWLGVMIALNAQAVNVSGWARLSGQTDHSGTRVLFGAVSPSARTDSTFTGLDGQFVQSLQPGVYDVEFAHAGYVTYREPNQVLLFDTQMDSVTLDRLRHQTPLGGILSGTLARDEYEVVDTIQVLAGTYLLIEPGTRLDFDPRIPMKVWGELYAIGTVIDSIFFTRRYDPTDSAWKGIDISGAPSSPSELQYCVVEGALSPYVNYWHSNGGGMRIVNSGPLLSHCAIRKNDALSSGGGMYCSQSSAMIEECTFSENNCVSGSGFNMGGGALVQNSRATFQKCTFKGNVAFEDGAGIATTESDSSQISECEFVGNRSYDGSLLYASGWTEVSRCVLHGNHAEASIGVSSGQPRIHQCTIFRDTSGYGAFHCSGAEALISSNIVANIIGRAAFFSSPARVLLDHNSFWGNQDDLIYDPYGYAPPAFGIVALTNANGDSCDTYYNLFLDPQFVDTAGGDYHLRGTSPCIDAGDPSLPRDPDGTVADMGAFYFDQLPVTRPERTAVRHYQLLQNYPNPFNAVTRIAFELPRAGEARLEVFDVLGRHVTTLASGPLREGSHEVRFDAGSLASGMYVYRLQAGDFVQAKKMLLVR